MQWEVPICAGVAVFHEHMAGLQQMSSLKTEVDVVDRAGQLHCDLKTWVIYELLLAN